MSNQYFTYAHQFGTSATVTGNQFPVKTTRENSSATSAVESAIEAAVYAHIRAIRALGRTKINTAEIARALDIGIKDVERALDNMKEKGVKPSSQ